MKLTLRAYARSRRLAPSSVHKAIRTGRIRRGADGLIDARLSTILNPV